MDSANTVTFCPTTCVTMLMIKSHCQMGNIHNKGQNVEIELAYNLDTDHADLLAS